MFLSASVNDRFFVVQSLDTYVWKFFASTEGANSEWSGFHRGIDGHRLTFCWHMGKPVCHLRNNRK